MNCMKRNRSRSRTSAFSCVIILAQEFTTCTRNTAISLALVLSTKCTPRWLPVTRPDSPASQLLRSTSCALHRLVVPTPNSSTTPRSSSPCLTGSRGCRSRDTEVLSLPRGPTPTGRSSRACWSGGGRVERRGEVVVREYTLFK